jgi:hypothetical protein
LLVQGALIPNFAPTLLMYLEMDPSLYEAAGYQKFVSMYTWEIVGLCLSNIFFISLATLVVSRIMV